MRLTDLLALRQGDCVSVVGAGGKTALIDRLADENALRGALIAPTARIDMSEVVERPGVTYLGREEGGKFVAMPLAAIAEAAKSAALTLMEADGSKRLPLKGWDGHEPVIPPFTTLTVGVVSARAVGLVATGEHVHRLPLFLAQTGLQEGDTVDAAAIARMILWCMDRHAVGRRAIFINQADDEALAVRARAVAARLDGFGGLVLIGSIREGRAWIAS